MLKTQGNSPEPVIKEALKSIDTGLLMGAPLNEYPDLLTTAATYLSKELQKVQRSNELSVPLDDQESSLKYSVYERLRGSEIGAVKCPSLDHFNKVYFEAQFPVKLQSKYISSIYHFKMQ